MTRTFCAFCKKSIDKNCLCPCKICAVQGLLDENGACTCCTICQTTPCGCCPDCKQAHCCCCRNFQKPNCGIGCQRCWKSTDDCDFCKSCQSLKEDCECEDRRTATPTRSATSPERLPTPPTPASLSSPITMSSQQVKPPDMAILKDPSQLNFYISGLQRWAIIAEATGT